MLVQEKLKLCLLHAELSQLTTLKMEKVFLAFNRAIADEAAMNLRKFSINAEAKTWHKLAISSIQHQFNSKLNNLSNANKDLIALMDSLGTIPSLNIKIERNEKDIKLKTN